MLICGFSQAIAEVPSGTGYVLDGFPRTRVQGRALQNMRIVPQKVIVINGSSDAIKARLAAQVLENL